MPTLEASGTQAATVGTEHTLSTLTLNRTYVLVVDAGAMANSDELELRVNTIVLAAGTQRLAYFGSYKHVQGQPIKISVPIPSDIQAAFTLKQTAGTGRSYPWKVLSI